MADTPANFPPLGNMFGEASAMPAFLGRQQFDQAMGQAQQNQQLQMQQEQRTAQMHPLEMLFKQAQTNHQNASSGLLNEQATAAGFTNKLNESTRNQQLETKIAELASKKSTAELETAENSINQELLNDKHPPEIRAKLLQLAAMFPKIRAEKEKQAAESERQLALERERGKTQKEIEQMRIDAGKYAEKTGKFSLSMEQQLAQLKEARQKAAYLKTFIEGPGFHLLPDAEQIRIKGLHDRLAAQAQAESPGNVPKPGGVDINQATGGAVATNPSVPQPTYGGASAPAGGTPTPKTQAEYDKLPSGTVYIDTDGVKKRKK